MLNNPKKKWWRWRESNPRPNKSSKRFLHAYLLIDFRKQAGQKQPTCFLAAEFSLRCSSVGATGSKE